MSCHVGAKTEPWSSAGTAMLLMAEPSLQLSKQDF